MQERELLSTQPQLPTVAMTLSHHPNDYIWSFAYSMMDQICKVFFDRLHKKDINDNTV